MNAIPPGIPRAALVTGAARRVGRTIALALAEAGFAVAVHCNASRDEAARTAADCRSRGVAACVIEADLADEASVAGLAEAAAALGPLGVLINNASIFERDEWDSVTRASWDAHLATNLRAPFVLTQAFARALPAAPAEGVVINMIDQRVWSLTPHFISYTVSKTALWTLTRTLALALAPRIRVNAIGPGPALPSPRQSAEQFARQEAGVPLRRASSPAEIARAVIAILGLPSMTGQMIALDGGQHLNWHPQAGYDPKDE